MIGAHKMTESKIGLHSINYTEEGRLRYTVRSNKNIMAVYESPCQRNHFAPASLGVPNEAVYALTLTAFFFILLSFQKEKLIL